MIPSKLALLENLTTVSITGTSFTGCAPEELGDAATSDVTQADCGEPAAFGSLVGGPIPAGTYEIERAPWSGGVVVLDWPADSGLMFVAAARTLIEEGQTAKYGDYGLMISNAEGTVHFAIDVEMAGEWPRVFDDNFSDVGYGNGIHAGRIRGSLGSDCRVDVGEGRRLGEQDHRHRHPDPTPGKDRRPRGGRAAARGGRVR